MWFFRSPEIVFGEDALSWLNGLQGRLAFIVSDQMLEQVGLVAMVQAKVGIDSLTYCQVEPDPSLERVKDCAAAMLAANPDWIIGLGGGSALDVAKAAWFLYERPDMELAAVNPFETFGLRDKARFITISTTSGTGADVSWGVALNDEVEQRKLVVMTPEMVADVAIVDPALVVGLPAGATADTGLDALTQAIEGYVNRWHNDFTDGLALKAIHSIFYYLPRAYKDGQDLKAREHLHNAATMAGLAFSNTAITLAHALGHAIQASFHTVHGRTVALFLPYVIQFTVNGQDSRYDNIARILGLPAGDEAEAAASLVQAIRQLCRTLERPLTLAELGISEADLTAAMPRLLENVGASPELIPSLRLPDEAEIEKLLWYAYRGQDVDF